MSSYATTVETTFYVGASLLGFWIFYILFHWLGLLLFPFFSCIISFMLGTPNGLYPLVIIFAPFVWIAHICSSVKK